MYTIEWGTFILRSKNDNQFRSNIVNLHILRFKNLDTSNQSVKLTSQTLHGSVHSYSIL